MAKNVISKYKQLNHRQTDLCIERVNIIDFVKLFFAFCIVAIHTELLSAFPNTINWYITHMVIRVGVPFFFVASGYFVGTKLHIVSDNKSARIDVCKNYIKRNLPPFLFWGSVGLLFFTIGLIHNKDKWIFLKVFQQALFYPNGAMWFVLACMVAVSIIAVLWNYKAILAIIGGGVFLCIVL